MEMPDCEASVSDKANQGPLSVSLLVKAEKKFYPSKNNDLLKIEWRD